MSMDANIASLHEMASRWLPALLDASIKGVVILGLAGVATLAMRKTSAAARQLVWFLAMASLLVLPILSAALPAWQVLPNWARVEVSVAPELAPAPTLAAVPKPPTNESLEPARRDQPTTAPTGLYSPPSNLAPEHSPLATAGSVSTAPDVPSAAAQDPPQTASPPTPTAPPAHEPVAATAARQTNWTAKALPWAFIVWLLGTFICLTPPLLGRLSLWRLQRISRWIVGGPWETLLSRAVAMLKLRRPVVLLQSDRRTMPMMWGTLRPRLLLPAEADEWPAERQWVVLLHELAHAKRWDYLTKLIAQLACALYWFNPLAWWAFKRLQREAEQACDDLVVASGQKPADYAEHLLCIASGLKADALAAHGSIAMARPSTLEGRLLAILDPRRSRRRLSLLLILLAALLGTAILVPLSILRARDAAADKPAKTEPGREGDAVAAPPATQPADSPTARAKQIAVLIEQLAAGTFNEREKAQRDLVEIGLLALPALREAAKGNGGERGLRAQTAIDEIWARLKQQVRLVQEGKPGVRQPIRQSLQAGQPVLIQAVRERWTQEQEAMVALHVFGLATKDDVPVLIKALEYVPLGPGDDGEWALPFDTEGALSQIGDPVIPALAAVLRDQTTPVILRLHVVTVLGYMRPSVEGVVPTLAEAIGDKSSLVRESAITELIRMGPAAKAALPAIEMATGDSNADVRKRATAALRAIRGPATQPVGIPAASKVTVERVAKLKKDIRRFRLDVGFGARLPNGTLFTYYVGLVDKADVLNPGIRGNHWFGRNEVVGITADQAARIIAYLSESGWLDRASDTSLVDVALPGDHHVGLMASGDGIELVEFGSGRPYAMLVQLTGLRDILDLDAAKAIDELLKRLDPRAGRGGAFGTDYFEALRVRLRQNMPNGWEVVDPGTFLLSPMARGTMLRMRTVNVAADFGEKAVFLWIINTGYKGSGDGLEPVVPGVQPQELDTWHGHRVFLRRGPDVKGWPTCGGDIKAALRATAGPPATQPEGRVAGSVFDSCGLQTLTRLRAEYHPTGKIGGPGTETIVIIDKGLIAEVERLLRRMPSEEGTGKDFPPDMERWRIALTDQGGKTAFIEFAGTVLRSPRGGWLSSRDTQDLVHLISAELTRSRQPAPPAT